MATRIMAALAMMLLSGGCALTTAQIDIPYQPAAAAAAVPGASGARVDVAASDGRSTYRDRVSSKKNGYGMEMAAIISTRDVPTSVGDAFRQELAARGFTLGTGGGKVQVELVRFYNDFKTGFFAGDSVASVAFNIKVTGPSGGIGFSRYYEATGIVPNIQVMGGDNAREALIKAFTAGVASVINDPDFIIAVLAAGGQAPQPVAMLRPAS